VISGGRSKRTVDSALGVPNNLLDNTPGLQIGQRPTGKRSIDLQPVDENGDGDETVGLDILVELVRGGLVEDNSMLGLVLDYIVPINPESAFPSSIKFGWQ